MSESEYVGYLDCGTTGVISRDSLVLFNRKRGNEKKVSVFPVKKVLHSNLDSPEFNSPKAVGFVDNDSCVFCIRVSG